ncbi:MAG: hypothetical protein RBS39_00265 [Phycisphaerales bacterium]|nr:hypothetical protein [Phycisphaerales bacterium]
MKRSLEALTGGLIDYAGLYPPAKLDMQASVENYARYAQSEERAMLGRFICPASRLREFSKAAAPLLPGTFATSGYREHADHMEAWPVSVVADVSLDEAIDLISRFNEHHDREEHGLATIDAIELRPMPIEEVDATLEALPDELMAFFEIDWRTDPRGAIASLSGTGCAAKIRTGGVTPDAIPPANAIARFINACSLADVPLKGTAGMHHPLRSEHGLTYEPDAPRGVMHGFVNFFLACALLHDRAIDEDAAARVLSETDPGAFDFDDARASWRGRSASLEALARARQHLALSYGSCSFEEPVSDLRELGWL